MSVHISKIKKALKLYNMVQRPTGNVHQDEVANRTFNEYIARHQIDIETLQGFDTVEYNHKYENRYVAELFLMISILIAEEKGLLHDYNFTIDDSGNCFYKGPGFLYDEIYPTFTKHHRKYVITRDAVRKKLEDESMVTRADGGFRIVGMNGSVITIMGNIVNSSVKYSEQAFYNAFLIKYELIANCVRERMKKASEKEIMEKPLTSMMNNDIDHIFQMFHKESIDEQID